MRGETLGLNRPARNQGTIGERIPGLFPGLSVSLQAFRGHLIPLRSPVQAMTGRAAASKNPSRVNAFSQLCGPRHR